MQPTTYYIASGLANVEAVRKLKKILDDAGWEHTYDWTVHGSVPTAMCALTAEAEAIGVLRARVVIALLPGGRGTHAELGIAIGSTLCAMGVCAAGLAEMDDRRLCVYSPDPARDFVADTSAFYHHPLVEKFTSMRDMINSLLDRPASADDLWSHNAVKE